MGASALIGEDEHTGSTYPDSSTPPLPCWLPAGDSGAIFDLSGTYRYLLWRAWDRRRATVAFIMLNPSTADAERLDPTIRRCLKFAGSWGFGRLFIVNLYAYRTADWRLLAKITDPIGRHNESFIRCARRWSDCVVVAWGNHGENVGREVPRDQDWCLGVTGLGNPKHPLYLPASTQLVRFERVQRFRPAPTSGGDRI